MSNLKHKRNKKQKYTDCFLGNESALGSHVALLFKEKQLVCLETSASEIIS